MSNVSSWTNFLCWNSFTNIILFVLYFLSKDFEGAAQIKESLNKARDAFNTLKDIEWAMRQAVAEEDYLEAARLKAQRDSNQIAALGALSEAESSISKDSHGEHVADSPKSIMNANSELEVHTNAPDAHAIDCHRNAPSSQDEDSKPLNQQRCCEEDVFSGDDFDGENGEPSVQGYEHGQHPLEGVPGFEEMPAPEDINDDGGKNSPDFINKVEFVMGSYVTKCFFSKNWTLREAALTKTSMVLPEVIGKTDIFTFTKNVCAILERATEDRIVQVFITTLILLDDCMKSFEEANMNFRDISMLLAGIMENLVSKLGDSKSKVADGADTALMSLALSPCLGPVYIGNQVTKRVRQRDAKAGRAICARFKFLRALFEEFREEGIPVDNVMKFVKEYGFGHKDADVREAAREISTTIYLVIGDHIFPMLQGLSERQLREYKAAFAQSCHSRATPDPLAYDSSKSTEEHQSPQGGTMDDTTRYQSPHNMATTHPPSGRGRGRGRRRLQEGQGPHPINGNFDGEG